MLDYIAHYMIYDLFRVGVDLPGFGLVYVHTNGTTELSYIY